MSEYENYLKLEQEQNTIFEMQTTLDITTLSFPFPLQFGTQLKIQNPKGIKKDAFTSRKFPQEEIYRLFFDVNCW